MLAGKGLLLMTEGGLCPVPNSASDPECADLHPPTLPNGAPDHPGRLTAGSVLPTLALQPRWWVYR